MKKTLLTIGVVLLVLIFLVGTFGAFALIVYFRNNVDPNNPTIKPIVTTTGDFVQFQSEEQFREYISKNQNQYSSRNSSMGLGSMDMMLDSASEVSLGLPSPSSEVSKSSPERYSDTNVQVVGIDEPDIVKTNGSEIFYSAKDDYYFDYTYGYEDFNYKEPITNLISALPVEDMEVLSEIENYGDLLLFDDVLVVIGYDTIYAYDVSKPASPTKLWEYSISDFDTSIVEARSLDGKIYLITQTSFYSSPVCPIPLLKMEKQTFEIRCDEIFYPSNGSYSEVTNTIMQINPEDGEITNNISIIGSYEDTTIYMSPENIFVTYTSQGDIVSIFNNFLLESSDLFDDSVIVKITKLNSYDISDSAKLLELETILNSYQAGFSKDDRLKFENDLQNQMDTYIKNHKRELETTMINKIDVKTFEIVATGSVPGSLLNQFSLDEYEGNLRVATTTANNLWGLPFSISNAESVNDVYVLDSNLKQTGSILDMGEGERIYSARFIGDKGYVVTFRETDPFYVLDLSNPKKPSKVGELKIPGYSSYLHPMSDDLILGVGKEDANVKLSLFDVSDPSKPTEVDKYTLKEYWSDILDTHHAFLLDKDHEVFFVPGSNGGYVFGYTGNKIELKKAVDDINAQRAIYINDNMYVLGSDKIIVLDENTWEKIKTFDLK